MEIEILNGHSFYTALLTKNKDEIYTAWYYKNKISQTVYEWDWRLKSFQGADDFYLINISCTNKGKLKEWLSNAPKISPLF